MAETVALTTGELDRLHVMTQLAERRLTRRRAAALLGLSARRVRPLYRAFRRDRAKALASSRRGRPSNRRFATATLPVFPRSEPVPSTEASPENRADARRSHGTTRRSEGGASLRLHSSHAGTPQVSVHALRHAL